MNNTKPLLSETFRDAFTQMLQGKQISTCVVGMETLSYTLKKYGNNEPKLLKTVEELNYGMRVGDGIERGLFPDITPKIMPSLLIDALGHALDAHNYQARRIGTNTTTVPYFCHLLDVVGILLDAGITDETILIAAAMHDAIEDTQYNANTIEYLFGLPVRRLVVQLTESEYNPDLPKAPKKQRCEAYINSLINCPDDIKLGATLISAADKIASGYDYLILPMTEVSKQLVLWFYRELIPIYDPVVKLYPMLRKKLYDAWKQMQSISPTV